MVGETVIYTFLTDVGIITWIFFVTFSIQKRFFFYYATREYRKHFSQKIVIIKMEYKDEKFVFPLCVQKTERMVQETYC